VGVSNKEPQRGSLRCCIRLILPSTGSVQREEQWIRKTAAGQLLVERLLAHPVFRAEPEMAKRGVEFLTWIARRTARGKPAKDWGIDHKDIENHFWNGEHNHPKYKEALYELKLLEQTSAPVPSPIPGKGRFTRFRVHESVIDAYHKARLQQRREEGFGDKLCKGNNARKRALRLKAAETIQDRFCRAHEVLCCTVEVDWLWDESFISDECQKVDTALDVLAELTWVDFDPVVNDGKRSRLYHPLAGFPKEVRKHLRVGDRVYRAEVDIRACWPTFLGAHLLKLHGDSNEALKAECIKWQEAFCMDGDENDPRSGIENNTEVEFKEGELKARLNQYLSGYLQSSEDKGWKPSTKHMAIDDWFADTNPEMHKAWKAAGPKKLGHQLGLHFETPLMTDSRLYDYADDQGITLYYQYDGFGVFAQPGSQEALGKVLEGLCRLMRDISTEKFGVPIVIRQKLAD
jgi:hypothetical protein